MIALSLLGCLDRLLEGPYVLAPGLGEARSVAPGLDGRLLVASSTGVYAIDGEGRAERVEDAPAIAVAGRSGFTYALREGRVSWEGGGIDVPGAVDILAGYDGMVVLYPDHYAGIAPGSGPRVDLGIADARGIAIGPDGSYLIVSEHALRRVSPEGALSTVVEGLTDARAAAIDAKGRIYVAQGEPQELWRVDGEALASVARWLGDSRDLHFGVGGLLPLENAYVANGAGTLDYVRPRP